MRLGWLIFLVIGAVFWLVRDVQARPIARPSGIIAPYQPYQASHNLPAVFSFKEHRITPVAKFVIEARVLSRRHYRYDGGATIAPVDLALGWGRMSDTTVLNKLSISQADRFYYVAWPANPPISPPEIMVNSANMHMIPSTPELAQRLKQIKAGNVVSIEGYLVNISGPNGFYWNTSTVRTDTGNGACELVWIERLVVK